MNPDITQYKKWTWKNPLMLHWIINPGLAFNELILGQRMPKIILIEKNPNKTLTEKSFIPCPHCGTVHSGLKWAPQNKTAFGNWFGLYCDNCEKIIPCLRNITSFFFLAITFPIWCWFKNAWKEKWLMKQKEKFSKPLHSTPPEFIWWIKGIQMGFVFFIIIMVIKFVIFQDPFTWKKPIGNLVGAIILGLIWGAFMKETLFKKKSSIHISLHRNK
ncbi:MAG TPA: hypothetical protein VIL78_19330 [Hanamia sp.]